MKIQKSRIICCLLAAAPSICFSEQKCDIGADKSLNSKSSVGNFIQGIFNDVGSQRCSESLSGYSNLDLNYETSSIADQTFRGQFQDQMSNGSSSNVLLQTEFYDIDLKSSGLRKPDKTSLRAVDGFSIINGD